MSDKLSFACDSGRSTLFAKSQGIITELPRLIFKKPSRPRFVGLAVPSIAHLKFTKCLGRDKIERRITFACFVRSVINVREMKRLSVAVWA